MFEKALKLLVHKIVKEYFEAEAKEQIKKLISETVGGEIVNPQDVPRIYANCTDIAKMFGVGRTLVYKDVEQMEKSPKYRRYVRQSSKKIKEISIYGYNKYRDELADNYLR